MALKLGRAVVGLGRLAGAAGEREAVLRAALRAGVTAFETATYHGARRRPGEETPRRPGGAARNPASSVSLHLFAGDGAADAVLVNALKSETRCDGRPSPASRLLASSPTRPDPPFGPPPPPILLQPNSSRDRSSVTVLTRVGLVEGRRKSELAVRFQGREEGAPFSTVDEVTANVLDPDFLRAEVRAAAERLGGYVDGVVLVNPEDYVVSRANRHLQHPKATSSAARGAAARGAAARGATPGAVSGTMSGFGAVAPSGSVLLANGTAGGGGVVGGASEFTLAASADRWAHELRDHLRTAFAVLEEEVAAGRLRHYGVASEGFGETQSALAGFDPRPLVGLAADAARLVHSAHKRTTPSSLALLEIAANPVERRAIQTLGPWARGLGLAVVLQRPLTARDRSGAPVPLIDPDITLARGRDDYSALLAALRDRFAVPSEPLAPDASEDDVATVEACQWMLSLLDQMVRVWERVREMESEGDGGRRRGESVRVSGGRGKQGARGEEVSLWLRSDARRTRKSRSTRPRFTGKRTSSPRSSRSSATSSKLLTKKAAPSSPASSTPTDGTLR